ncbi:PL29 family lyase N-terminal domain-containing protein [uncultured Alistipes sp.]|uniref:PL29 family lyase N-terminal domain-containing protein n=1 Tax=uncultured Alistipes sp. TaxID=538949 RepID=UPI0026261519|nr:PL29 family lyase N-terminal domain-containing protein [uncultured Alistipes sp.]
MKKLLAFAALFAVVALTSCKYDDDDLWNSVHGLENRVAKLEELCKQMNTNISSLQTIVTALQNNVYVTGTTPLMKDGKEIGYTITFSKGNPITIYHGKDGQDGEDGTTPTIGVKKDTDGVYYWTLNGEFIVVDGGKIQAEGKDGTNGTNGTTPQFKIENDYWFISYDNGDTWTLLGKATGEDGKDGQDGVGGDSMFAGVDYKTSTDYVIFTLADGTQIKLPTWSAFEALQRLCNETNTNLSALQTIVTALQNNDYITSVDPLTENGKVVGYTIKFAKSNPIVIYNGKDGADGVDGNTPVIGVKKDADGIYYWTLDGEFIVVDGQKIKTQGTDGNNGTDGSDGVTPKLEIREGYWWISYDNGANWTQLGKAMGEDGKDADSIKITQDENNVYFELADGTVITISKTGQTIDPNVIQFEDENVKKLCVAIWDADGDHELSYDEAAKVTTIGATFKGNTKIQLFNELQHFTGLTTLDDTFNGCSNLWRVTIPANVETISSTTFSGCSQLKRVIFEKGSKLTAIPANTFASLPLSIIEIPANIEVIEANAFRGCSSLTIVTFEEGAHLNTIKGGFSTDAMGAFAHCTSLTSIEIPASVETIEASVFSGCSSLSTVNFENQSCLKIIGANYTELPDVRRRQQMGVFYNCPITEIKLPASLETIEVNAFIGCPLLKTVTFENESKLKFINGTYDGSGGYHGAFYGLEKLEIVDMSGCSQIEAIGKAAFWNCSNLKKIKIGTEIPPVLVDNPFQGAGSSDTYSIRLIVPTGCVDAYETEWGRRFYVSDYDF